MIYFSKILEYFYIIVIYSYILYFFTIELCVNKRLKALMMT
jgi:hypothetical protein